MNQFQIEKPVWYVKAKKKAIIKEFLPNGLIRITYHHPETDKRIVEDVLPEDLKKYKQPFQVKVKKLVDDAIVPKYQSKGAAGFDLHTTEDILIPANTVYQLITGGGLHITDHVIRNNNSSIAGTGLAFEIPAGYELEIRGRSGNAFKYRVFSFNGTVDADYRGEVKLLLMNLGNEDISFKKGERVAQGVIKKVEQAKFLEVDELSQTERGTDGLGSTGTN